MATTQRTTVRLDEGLLNEAKREARRRGETLTRLVEQGLRHEIARRHSSSRPRRRPMPVSKATGGVLPGIDISNSAELLDRLDGFK